MRLPAYFISHGGGPWPWMEEARASYAGLARSGAAQDEAGACSFHEDTSRGIVVSSFRLGALPAAG